MDKIIHQSVKLACSSQRAFEMFTVDRLVRSWLAPKAEIKPVVGGQYHVYWDKSDPKKDSTYGCKITALEPGALLALEWKSPSQFQHFMNDADPKTHVAVFFSPADDRHTNVHLIHTGWRSNDEWEEARQWFDNAWKKALLTLKRKFEEES